MVDVSGVAFVVSACGGPENPVLVVPSTGAPVGGVGSGVARLEKADTHEVHSMKARQRLNSRLKTATNWAGYSNGPRIALAVTPCTVLTFHVDGVLETVEVPRTARAFYGEPLGHGYPLVFYLINLLKHYLSGIGLSLFIYLFVIVFTTWILRSAQLGFSWLFQAEDDLSILRSHWKIRGQFDRAPYPNPYTYGVFSFTSRSIVGQEWWWSWFVMHLFQFIRFVIIYAYINCGSWPYGNESNLTTVQNSMVT